MHLPALAPTQEMLAGYRKEHRDWDIYERQFLDLMRARRIEESIPREIIDGGCLLCSEDKPHRCHRRLVAEYLDDRWGGIEVRHLAGYRKEHKDWNTYEKQFLDLMGARRIEESIPREVIDGGCLLCSEDKPHRCHRRLVAEYLDDRWGGIEVRHLG